MRRAGALILSTMCFLTGCGTANPGAVGTTPADDPWADTSVFDTGTDATFSATASALVPGVPAGALATVSALPNAFRRAIGRDATGLANWLCQPAGLACDGARLLVADGGHRDLFGSFGMVLAFDGSAPQAVTPVGAPYDLLDPARPAARLGSGMQAIACSSQVLFAADDRGVYGFMLDSGAPLNFGSSYGAPGRDMAVVDGALYLARADRVEVVDATTMLADPATPSLELAAVGLGSDPQGNLYVASATGVSRYSKGQLTLSFDGKGTDGAGPGFQQLADVASDPRTGEIYALDRSAILRYDAAGRFLCRFGQDQIRQGASLTVDASGDIFVTDADPAARRVLQFEPAR